MPKVFELNITRQDVQDFFNKEGVTVKYNKDGSVCTIDNPELLGGG